LFDLKTLRKRASQSKRLRFKSFSKTPAGKFSDIKGYARVRRLLYAKYRAGPTESLVERSCDCGVYVLAGEMSRQPNNIPTALESYERVLRPYVESIQKLPPGIPWIANPQSTLGIRVFETVI
jgi:hypothetical protein